MLSNLLIFIKWKYFTYGNKNIKKYYAKAKPKGISLLCIVLLINFQVPSDYLAWIEILRHDYYLHIYGSLSI